MPSSKRVASGVSPTTGSPSDVQNKASLAARVLGDPSIFPDTFTAWIPRWIMQNINFKITQQQLPSNGAIHVVSGTGEAAVFQNSWVYFGSGAIPSYYKDPFTRVYLSGQVKSGTVGQAIFTLPPGYRPQQNCIFAVVSNGVLGVVTVNVDGTVVATSGNNTYFSLDGISFRQYA